MISLTELKEQALDLRVGELKDLNTEELEKIIITLEDLLRIKMFLENKIQLKTRKTPLNMKVT